MNSLIGYGRMLIILNFAINPFFKILTKMEIIVLDNIQLVVLSNKKNYTNLNFLNLIIIIKRMFYLITILVMTQ